MSPQLLLNRTEVAERISETAGGSGTIVNNAAWQEFCDLIRQGGGVCDYPDRGQSPLTASAKFYRYELARVNHALNNEIPFLIEHCSLANKTVMEFGAGTGGLSVAMMQAGIQSVDAIEPVRLNSRAAACRVRAYGYENQIRCRHVEDTGRLPYSDGVFDAVVCSSVLQYVPHHAERKRLLTEMARVVKPGGLLIICGSGNGFYPGGPHSSRWWSNLLPEHAARCSDNRGISFWELRRIVKPLGLDIAPQGIAALRRWKQRAISRKIGRLGHVAIAACETGLRVGGPLLGLLTGAPLDALLPFPELAFRMRA